jgi:hypothetical protein
LSSAEKPLLPSKFFLAEEVGAVTLEEDATDLLEYLKGLYSDFL